MAKHHSYKAEIKELKDTSEVEIRSSVPALEFDNAVKDALSDLSKEITIPGFRKGSAPEKMVVDKIGENSLLSEGAERAISHAYSHIIETEEIDAIGRPTVSITKMARGNPLEFVIRTAVLPKMNDFDYVMVARTENAKERESSNVNDDEVNESIERIRRGRAITKEGEKNPVLPELDDEFAKSLGDFKGVADLKEKVRENLAHEKKHRVDEKRRLALIDAIAQKVTVAIPNVLIELELDRMIARMKHDIERMGLSFDDYLKHIKKTEPEMRGEWKKDAEKKVKLDLALDYISRKEKIFADKSKIEAEIKHLKEHHKDVDTSRAEIYYENMFRTQAVFDYLESIK